MATIQERDVEYFDQRRSVDYIERHFISVHFLMLGGKKYNFLMR